MIIGLQLIAIIFALIMLYFAYLHYSRREISGVEIFSWFIIWIITICIVVFPELLQTFAKTFAINRVFDLMVIGGFIVVISMVYLAYIKTRKLEQKMEQLVRESSLKEIKKKKHK